MRNTIINVEGFFKNSCLGLAANQIGENYRIILMSRYPRNKKSMHKFLDVYINPEITKLSEDSITLWEGCISDPT